MEQVVDDDNIQTDDVNIKNDRTIAQGEYETANEQTSANLVQSKAERWVL